MRVAIVTESFLPMINGVTTSVCRVAEQLAALGHDVVIVAPEPAPAWFGPIPVHTVRSVPVRQFPTGVPSGRVEYLLAEIAPDVVQELRAMASWLGLERLSIGDRGDLASPLQRVAGQYARG